MFVDNQTQTAQQVGIQVMVAPDGWRVAKGVQFLCGSCPEVLQVKKVAQGAALFPCLVMLRDGRPILRDSRASHTGKLTKLQR